jgi:FkbM family methyltransferase
MITDRWRQMLPTALSGPTKEQTMRDLHVSELGTMSRADAELAIRERVRTVYLGDKCVLARVLGRQKLFLSTDDTGFGCNVMLDGYWEIWLTQFFARTVKPGMTVIDVGANFGYYSILFGEAVGPRGHVIAVEPVPATAAMLTRSIALNGYTGTTTIVQAALGQEPAGHAHLIIPGNEPKNATVIAAAAPGSFEVPLTNLDTLALHRDRVDLIKIDAEGAEIEILAGMRQLIERHAPAVMLEFNAARYPDRAVAFLASLRRQFQRIRMLDFDGELKTVSDSQLLDASSNEDWLLFLEVQR